MSETKEKRDLEYLVEKIGLLATVHLDDDGCNDLPYKLGRIRSITEEVLFTLKKCVHSVSNEELNMLANSRKADKKNDPN